MSWLLKNLSSGFVPKVLQFGDIQVVTTALLAEGGYSFVYSAREVSASPRLFAVKKVIVQDSELREVRRLLVQSPCMTRHAGRKHARPSSVCKAFRRFILTGGRN